MDQFEKSNETKGLSPKILREKANHKISDILRHFDVKTYKMGGLLVSNCPIHDGDNTTAFNINVRDEYQGRWFCNTRGCHQIHANDILGLVWCLLEKEKDTQFYEVLNFLERLCGNEIIHSTTRDEFSSFFAKSTCKRQNANTRTRNVVRSKIILPSSYYISRNFSKEVLDVFDIGECHDKTKEMYNRAIFPVYDENDEFMVGCTGRTIINDPIKWKNQNGFNKSLYLYGYGKAKAFIKETRTIILCEGQGDVLRLYEAGVPAVSIMGSTISDSQEFLIQKSGAMNIITVFDNDDAGHKGRSDLYKKMSRLFNVRHIIPSKNDIGDMLVSEIDKEIKPQLKGLI